MRPAAASAVLSPALAAEAGSNQYVTIPKVLLERWRATVLRQRTRMLRHAAPAAPSVLMWRITPPLYHLSLL